MPVKGKLLDRTTYKDISKVYLKDGRTVDAIYAPVNGHYELVYDTANTSTIKGTLPLTFTDDHANGTILDAFTLYNKSENVVGDKTRNLAPSLDEWSPDVTINDTAGGTGEETYGPTSRVMSSPFIEVKPSTRYTLRVDRVDRNRGVWTNCIWFNEDKIVISASQSTTQNDAFFQITSPANAKYIRIVNSYTKYVGFFDLTAGPEPYSMIPSGYACPIIVNGTTKTIYLPSPITNKFKYVPSKMISRIEPRWSELNYSGGGIPTNFSVYENNSYDFCYIANGKVYSSSDANHNVDRCISGIRGTRGNYLPIGTYTLSVTVKNPPVIGDWFVAYYIGNGSTYPWRGCTVNRTKTVNGIAKSSTTITVDSTEASKVGYSIIRFGANNCDVYFANTIVTVSIVEGSKPSYPRHELIDSEYNVTKISGLPIFPTNNGTNTFDVGTTNKPTKASVSW